MKAIQPLSKSKLSSLRKLLQKKYRAGSKKFLVEGLRTVEEVLASDWNTEMVLVTKSFADGHDQLLKQVIETNIPLYTITSRDIETMSDTEHAQGVVAIVHQKKYGVSFLEDVQSGIVVAVDGITEPGNMGTIIRTCDWFGVNGVIVSTNSVELFNPKVVRATAGSIFHVPIATDVRLQSGLAHLKRKGFHLYVTALDDGIDVSKVAWAEKAVIVFGNEARGVSEEIRDLADTKVFVPRIGRAESLNVGVACGVVLGCWRLFGKRDLAQ